jgi:uncharacterized protein (TIGR02145 family)
MKKIILILSVFSILYSCSKKEATPTVVTSIVPSIITIGTQKWMNKNLDVTTYRNGDTIPQVIDKTTWSNLTTGAWCFYNNDAANGAKYGKLYNWYAVNDSRGLAPQGWHIPTDAEWTTLSTLLGGEDIAGGKLKEVGTLNWMSPNTKATNETGFLALPGSVRDNSGIFFSVGNDGAFWSATLDKSNFVWVRFLTYNSGNIYRYSNSMRNGFSVRCLKD